MSEPRIERAFERDWPAIRELVVAAGLPAAGLPDAGLPDAGLPADGFETGLPIALVARDAEAVVGCAAVEVYGDAGLLRSVAVAQEWRGRGIGRRLVEEAERLAVARGVSILYLLTETAADWFPRLGYEPRERSSVPADVAASPEFAYACPVSAELLARELPRAVAAATSALRAGVERDGSRAATPVVTPAAAPVTASTRAPA